MRVSFRSSGSTARKTLRSVAAQGNVGRLPGNTSWSHAPRHRIHSATACRVVSPAAFARRRTVKIHAKEERCPCVRRGSVRWRRTLEIERTSSGWFHPTHAVASSVLIAFIEGHSCFHEVLLLRLILPGNWSFCLPRFSFSSENEIALERCCLRRGKILQSERTGHLTGYPHTSASWLGVLRWAEGEKRASTLWCRDLPL